MRLRQVGSVMGLAALAACTSTNSTGVIAMGPDTYGMKVASRNLAGAAEKGLTDATTFCNGMGRQTQLLRTQITNDDYQLVFRCMGGPPQLPPRTPAPVPSVAGVPIPDPNAPVLAGAAFAPPRTIAGMTTMAARQRQAIFPVSPPVIAPAPPPANTMPPLGSTAVAPLLGGRIAAPGYAAAPPPGTYPSPFASPTLPSTMVEPEAPRRGLFSRLNPFSSDEPAARPALPQTGGGFPLPPQPGGVYPLGQGALPPAPLAPVTAPMEPLRSPLAAGTLPNAPPSFASERLPTAAPIFPTTPASVPAAAPQPLAAPAPLPPVPAAEPVAAPPRSLPPVPLQPLPRLNTNVPATLPPPSGLGGNAPTVPQAPPTEPPTSFWSTFRN